MRKLTYSLAHITFHGKAILMPGVFLEEKDDLPFKPVKGTLTLKVKGIETSERSKKG